MIWFSSWCLRIWISVGWWCLLRDDFFGKSFIPDRLEAGGSAGSYFGGGQAWLGNIAIQDFQSRDKWSWNWSATSLTIIPWPSWSKLHFLILLWSAWCRALGRGRLRLDWARHCNKACRPWMGWDSLGVIGVHHSKDVLFFGSSNIRDRQLTFHYSWLNPILQLNPVRPFLFRLHSWD